MKAEVWKILANEQLILCGDGRNDSPRHCAKYCVYVLMEQLVDIIVDIQVTHTRETGGVSTNMEVYALKKLLERIVGKLLVSEIVTDASATIMKLVRDMNGKLGKIVSFGCFVVPTYYPHPLILSIYECHILLDKYPKEFSGLFHALDIWHKSVKLSCVLSVLLARNIATSPIQDTALRCLSFNARSLKSVNKHEDGYTTSNLSMFQELVYSENFDIIIVTETWLNNTISNKEILPIGYNIVRRDRRSEKRSGGVLMALCEGLQ